jgi:hypothetical protein
VLLPQDWKEFNRSRQDVFPAKELGTEAGRILSRKGSGGKILASLSGGIYFLTDEQEVFWVWPDPAPMHRRCIRMESLPVGREIQFGQRFRVEPPLIVGDLFVIDLRHAEGWSPFLPLPAQGLPSALVKENCERLIGFLLCLNPREGLSPLIPSLWARSNEELEFSGAAEIYSKISPVVSEIARACRRGDLPAVLEKGKGLIGLGPGLTPSGDDFMGGLLFSAFMLRRFYPGALSWNPDRMADFVAEAQSRTHPLSFVFLRDFASGHAPAPLAEVVQYLFLGRDFERAVSAVGQLLNFGHSTGGDMLTGLLTGMLMAPKHRADA